MGKKLLTRSGYERLKSELELLRTTTRNEVAEKIREARELGNVLENIVYDSAVEEQGMIEGKIKELEDALANCEIVDEIKANGAVVLGSEILVDIDGRQETFIVVGSAEADPINRKISEESPVGRALIGAKKGDTIEVKLPNATMVCKIVEIK